jgi:hypothetical protein
MGQARKAGGKKPGFIDTVLGSIERMYADVLQQIKPWTPSAPRLQKQPDRDDVEAQPSRGSETRADTGDDTTATAPARPVPAEGLDGVAPVVDAGP